MYIPSIFLSSVLFRNQSKSRSSFLRWYRSYKHIILLLTDLFLIILVFSEIKCQNTISNPIKIYFWEVVCEFVYWIMINFSIQVSHWINYWCYWQIIPLLSFNWKFSNRLVLPTVYHFDNAGVPYMNNNMFYWSHHLIKISDIHKQVPSNSVIILCMPRHLNLKIKCAVGQKCYWGRPINIYSTDNNFSEYYLSLK